MNKATAVVGFILSFIAGMMLMWAIQVRGGGSIKADSSGPSAASRPTKVNPGAVKAEFYVMSQCPYGVQAVNGVKDAVDKLGADVDFQIDFIGNATPDGNLSSMHGPNEVTGDITQLCAMKYAPAKYLNMIACQNKNYREIATNWEQCATEIGAPMDKMRACVSGPEGKKLLTDSFQRSQQRGATGSPTIYIGGKQYSGQRKPNDFVRAICAEYKDKKPAVCNSIPESPKVNVTILTDKRCTECQPERYQGMIKSRIGNPVIKTVDYSDPEGQKLYAEAKPGNLPALIFDKTLDGDKDATEAFNRGLKVSGDWKVAPLGGEWNPVCMGEGGCDKEECKNTLGCRKEMPNKLEVFVMSQCPFGVKALNAMEEVLKNFKGSKLDFQVHYIGNGDAKSLSSMHGQGEVDEDLREVCAMKHFAKDYKWMDYVLCRNKNIRDTNWQECAKGDIKADVIKKCAESDEGKQLLEAEFKIASGLGIGASPTWLANNKFKFSGIDAESVRKNICDHNKDLKGCENKLSGQTGAPVQGGCGN
jgi:predicted DsbA family dithiol-disulfide isomerase